MPGPIPSSLGLLPHLKFLNLSNNAFTSVLPKTLCRISANFVTIDVTGCDFSNLYPSCLFDNPHFTYSIIASSPSMSDAQALCYVNRYSDLMEAYGYDRIALKRHWAASGFREGRNRSCTDYVFAFEFTRKRQSWTVPASVTSIEINACGAAGGPNDWAYPGSAKSGGRIRSVIPVVSGTDLFIFVGECGRCADRSTTIPFNGGGIGGKYSNGANGGGSTDIRTGDAGEANDGSGLTSTRLVVAGGGGGAFSGGLYWGGSGGGLIAGDAWSPFAGPDWQGTHKHCTRQIMHPLTTF